MKLIIRLICLLVFVMSFSGEAKTSHLFQIKINYDSLKYGENELNYFKVILFNENFTDSIQLKRYNNCLVLKGKFPQLNGSFFHYDQKVKYWWVQVEHPRYAKQLVKLNTDLVDKDSVDVRNKRHHIFTHVTELTCEEICPQNPNYDYMFWSNNEPFGGYMYENLIGVLFKDSLGTDSLKSIGEQYDLNFHSVAYTGKLVVYNHKKKLKKKKNKVLIALLNDSNLVDDAGFMMDTTNFIFASSFYRICGLSVKEIEKRKFNPIGGLQSLAVETMYIREKELEMGCGLYKYDLGMGYWIFKYIEKLKGKELKDKCLERSKWLKLDKEYFVLHMWNYSKSGGNVKGKKKRKNEKRMLEIHEEQKEILKQYNAPFGIVEPIVITPEN